MTSATHKRSSVPHRFLPPLPPPSPSLSLSLSLIFILIVLRMKMSKSELLVEGCCSWSNKATKFTSMNLQTQSTGVAVDVKAPWPSTWRWDENVPLQANHMARAIVTDRQFNCNIIIYHQIYPSLWSWYVRPPTRESIIIN